MAKSKSGLIFKIILGILIVLIILVVAVLFFIDTLAKNALEKGAPLVLGTNVSVERLHIEPLKGRVEITNLIVDNPQGTYSSEYAIKLGDVIADVDINTVLNHKIRIEEMFLKDVDIVYETNVLNSNLQEILDNVKKLDTAEKKEQQEDEAKGEKDDDKTLQVDLIELSSVGVTVQAKGAATGLPIKVTIDPMTNLGTDEEGITPVGLTLRILGAIVTTAIKTAGGSVGDAASAISDATSAAVAGATSAAVDAGKNAVNDATNAAADAIKGLFGGKKEDAPEAQPQGN